MFTDLGGQITKATTHFVQDPTNPDAFYFLEHENLTTVKLWHLVWPTDLTLVVDLVGELGGDILTIPLLKTASIAYNPATSAYHYCFMGAGNSSGYTVDVGVDIKLSDGSISVGTPNIPTNGTSLLYTMWMSHYVSGGELYFCWQGTKGDVASANSLAVTKKAGSSTMNSFLTTVGSISARGLTFPDVTEGQFMVIDGDWKIVNMITPGAGAHSGDEPTAYETAGVGINAVVSGDSRYFLAKSGNYFYMNKFDVVNNLASVALIGSKVGSGDQPLGWGWQAKTTFDCAAFVTAQYPNYLQCGRIIHTTNMTLADVETIKFDENNGAVPATGYYSWVSAPYAYVYHTTGISGPAITKILATGFKDPTKVYSQIIG
jgi:hypothetical protein